MPTMASKACFWTPRIDVRQAVHCHRCEISRDLIALSRDVECQALARAVKYHVERRVFLNGLKTVVFR
jgi:formyltetrahydrofolate deformylase